MCTSRLLASTFEKKGSVSARVPGSDPPGFMLFFVGFFPCLLLNSAPKGHQALVANEAPAPRGAANGNERGVHADRVFLWEDANPGGPWTLLIDQRVH